MGKFFGTMFLIVAVVTVFMWAISGTVDPVRPLLGGAAEQNVEKEESLGNYLYEAKEFPPLKKAITGRLADAVVIPGYLTALEQQDVPSNVPGQILFVGEQIAEGAVQAAGVAAFLAEPCYYANLYMGPQPKSTFYRRFYDGEVVSQDQMVAVVDYTKALGNLLEKKAKLSAAYSEERAAKAAAREGDERYRRGLRMVGTGAISQEELGEKELTKIKLDEEYVAKTAAVEVSKTDLTQAEILMHQHEIRNKLPYNKSVIKNILRSRGNGIKEGDTVMQLQNIDRLIAEAQIDSQYRDRLRKEMTATIEPSQEEGPARKLLGHFRDITCVGVSRDAGKPMIVSGSEDGLVLVWAPTSTGPMAVLRHGGPVQSLACTGPGADKNLLVVGLQDGSIVLWDLDGDGQKPLHKIGRDMAHGDAVTALAFSPDGRNFASGSVDGNIRMWVTDTGKELYTFDAAHGAASTHTGTVTSLTFLPQARLVSAARDATIRVWKLKEKGAVLEHDPIFGRDNKVTQLGASADGKFMLFDQGRTLQLLSVEKGRPVNTLQTPGGTTPFETLAIFSNDGSLLLTAGAAEGRLQLWRTPTETERGFEVRQMVSKEHWPATCAAFAPGAGQGGENSFAVSASKHILYIWPVPTQQEINSHRIENVPLKMSSPHLDSSTRQMRIGFEISNLDGRLLPGRPVTIVID